MSCPLKIGELVSSDWKVYDEETGEPIFSQRATGEVVEIRGDVVCVQYYTDDLPNKYHDEETIIFEHELPDDEPEPL